MTLGELRATVRLTLADATAWPDASLDRWIRAAIRLYSAHFPRQLRAEISLATGTQAYALPGGVSGRGVISVAYPAGSMPPRFLWPCPEWSDRFAAGWQCYAVRGVAPEELSDSATIVFGETVATGQMAVVEYWGPHALPDVGDDAAAITVPILHWEALSAYCEFAARFELECDEAVAADGSTIVLSELGEGARRAWLRVKEVLDRLAWLGAPSVEAQPNWGRIGL